MTSKFTGNRYIVVDLDGTLINSDLFFETFFIFVRKQPFRIIELLIWLFHGKSYIKRRLADQVDINVSSLPYNAKLLDWLNIQASGGAKLVLATASDQRIARKIADYLKIFDYVFGTETYNLSSKQKCKILVANFGEGGFEYVGNSSADLQVWPSASIIHVVNPEFGVLSALKNIGPIQTLLENRPNYFGALFKTMRFHQWSKNLLIFVPLLASHRLLEFPLILAGFIAFFSFGLCASSVYILNDLFDLPYDRAHPTKCNRQLAAGAFPIFHAALLVPLFLITSFSLAFFYLPIKFVALLLAYYILTLGYTLWLKRLVMIDVITLAMLYTTRVLAGAAAMMLVTTFWILAFCMFIFLSLAFVKRYTELRNVKQRKNQTSIPGRGYQSDDLYLLTSLGGASGYTSVLVLALYINDMSSAALYHDSRWMWLACPLLMFWLSRVWLLAHRGEMYDDPIVFALRDNVSRWVGLIFLLVFVLAAL
jgi:4-hydroxybenzoate polyprenyltransferase